MQHDIVTREDWMASADDVFLRFNKRSSKNVNALSAIPIHLLSKGKEGNQQLHPLYEAFKAGTLREPRLYSAADLEIKSEDESHSSSEPGSSTGKGKGKKKASPSPIPSPCTQSTPEIELHQPSSSGSPPRPAPAAGPSGWRSPTPAQKSVGVGRSRGPSGPKSVGIGRTPSPLPSVSFPLSHGALLSQQSQSQTKESSGPLHKFNGGFPSQTIAMNDPFYLEGISVIVVEDPTLRCTQEASKKTSWMMNDSMRTIPQDWLDNVNQTLPDCVFAGQETEGYTYWEWLHVFYALESCSGGPCKLGFMTWESFKKALLNQRCREWKTLVKADLVLGGLVLASDFMNPDSKPFALDEFQRAMDSIRGLSGLTTIYPSPDQQILLGHTRFVMNALSDIARDITHTPFPLIVAINDPTAPDLVKRSNLYLQREFSQSSNHTLVVSDTPAFKTQFSKLVEETEALYNHLQIKDQGIQPSWLGMELLTEMETYGKVKVFFVGGMILHMFHTKPKGDDDLQITSLIVPTPLELIRQYGLVNPMMPSSSILTGEIDLVEFATSTFRALVLQEEALLEQRGRSDLRVFCCLDISVLKDSQGDLHYFTNEVSNTLRSNLFFPFFEHGRNVGACDIAIALRTLVAMERSQKAHTENL